MAGRLVAVRRVDSHLRDGTPTDGFEQSASIFVVLISGRHGYGDAVFRPLVNSQAVPIAELSAKLLAIFHGRPGSVMFVDGAVGLTYGEVAHVIDIAKGAGISTVGLLPKSLATVSH